jgi:hypothetical protein
LIIGAALLVALAGAAALISDSTSALDIVGEMLAKAAVGNWQRVNAELISHHSELHLEGNRLFALTFVTIACLVVFFAALTYDRSIRVARLSARLEQPPQQLDRALIDYNKSTDAASKIFAELYNKNRAEFHIRSIHEMITVHDDGTSYVRREYVLKAGPEGARCWRCIIVADDSAEDVTLLSAIDFRALCFAGAHKLHYLLTHNASREKEVLLFFTPSVEPQQEVRFQVTYNWPRFAGDIVKNDRTKFHTRYRTLSTDDRVEISYEIRFAKSLGDIACTLVSEQLGGELADFHETNYWVWRYTHGSANLHEEALTLEVKRTPPPPVSRGRFLGLFAWPSSPR